MTATSFDPWSPAFVADPYPAYARLRETGRVVYFEPSNQWLIPHFADVSALLRDRRLGRTYLHRYAHEDFGRTPPPPEHEPFHTLNDQGMLDMEPPDHTRIRRLVSKAFTPRTVEQLAPAVQRIADGLVAGLRADGGGDLIAHIAEPLPVAVIAEMLGIPESERAPLRPWSADICGMYELNPSEETAAKAVRASIEFSDYIRGLIAERRKKPGDDLITGLIAAHDEGGPGARGASLEGWGRETGGLTEQEMISTCVLLLNAGHEATVKTTGNGWWALFRHPDQLELLRADHSLIPAAVEEILRYDTPLQLFERWVLDEIEVAGTVIPQGSEIAMLFGSANRDPARTPDPDRFDITRDESPHISFSAGIHYCIGAPLARLELAVAFATVLRDLPGLRLVREPEWQNNFVIRGLKELLVEL